MDRLSLPEANDLVRNRQQLWDTYGVPREIDPVAALMAIGRPDLNPRRVYAAVHATPIAADAYRQADERWLGAHPAGTADVECGVLVVYDLSAALAWFDPDPSG